MTGQRDPTADPFRERQRPRYRLWQHLLGARFEFTSDSAALLELVASAYRALPPQRLRRAPAHCRIHLILGAGPAAAPRIQPYAAPGLIAGAAQGSSFMAVNLRTRSALVLVSPALLRHPRLVRYELLEFAAYALAARVQRLVPLHAACVASAKGAALLFGHSGAGKSTLVLQALQAGLTFLAEDSVLLEPRSLQAVGVPSYVHVRADGRRFLRGSSLAAALGRAPVIVRRSGVRKYELDVRGRGLSLARGPQPVRALVFLSAQRSRSRTLMHVLPSAQLVRRLRADQPYAAAQRGWPAFLRAAAQLPAYELRRGQHPREALAALVEVLGKP